MASTEEYTLTRIEKDAVGEVANMCMGASATALSTILGKSVAITTPEVESGNWKELITSEELKYVCVKVGYSAGIVGSNVLLLNEKDALTISNIMIGMDSTEITELELSCMGEVTNQMIGASTTTLSNIVDEMLDISPPEINLISKENVEEVFESDSMLNEGFIQIKFKLEIEGLIDSTMIQVYPYTLVQTIVEKMEQLAEIDEPVDVDGLVEENIKEVEKNNQDTSTSEKIDYSNTQAAGIANNTPAQEGMPSVMSQVDPNMMAQGNPAMMPNMMAMQGIPYMYPPNMFMQGQPPQEGGVQNNVNVQPAQFTSFMNGGADSGSEVENINLIMDVPLEVTVELGRTNKSISEILEFKPGTIVELNKIAGDPIDVLVNGKLVAVGEVVVIDENFGIRIVDIIK